MLQSVEIQQHIMALKKTPKTPPDLLTVAQAADELGMTPEGVRVAIKRSKLLEARLYGKVYLIERSALKRYRDARKMGRPPGTKKKPPARRTKKKS